MPLATVATNTTAKQTMLVVVCSCAILLRQLLKRNGVAHVLDNKGAFGSEKNKKAFFFSLTMAADRCNQAPY